MPELPEIESLRRSLGQLVGARVTSVKVHRTDMVVPSGAVPLPRGSTVKALHRHGKQLVVESARNGCLLVHLGMSGSLRLVHGSDPRSDDRHVHAEWRFDLLDGSELRLLHRDPRRFGWLEAHEHLHSVRRAWADRLGPDALTVEGPWLHGVLQRTRRAVKTVLLDQAVIAGIGNIYADEALFRAGVHPLRPARQVKLRECVALARAIRQVLQGAVEKGGSTIRDHRTADGAWGSFQRMHKVYGKAGLPCTRCRASLRGVRLQQRATVFCATCQPRRPRGLPGAVDGS